MSERLAAPDLRQRAKAALDRATNGHRLGHFEEIRAAYDDLSESISHAGSVEDDVQIVRGFLDNWSDAAYHDWQFHEPFGPHDWLRLAKDLTVSMATGRPIDPSIRGDFYDYVQPRREPVWRRLVAFLKRRTDSL